jgi:integrase
VVVPGGLAEKGTKTDRFRVVALDEVGIALLTRHRAQVDEWARQAETAVPSDAYVFSQAVDGSKPFRPDNVTGFFTRVRDSLGLFGVRLHDLRHSAHRRRSGRAYRRWPPRPLRPVCDPARVLPRVGGA